MARPAGFEPATHGLEGRCSIQLSYGRLLMEYTTRLGHLELAGQVVIREGILVKTGARSEGESEEGKQ